MVVGDIGGFKVHCPISGMRVARTTIANILKRHGIEPAPYGVDPKLIADQQGHTFDVNLNVYTQTSLESRRVAVETLASAFVN